MYPTISHTEVPLAGLLEFGSEVQRPTAAFLMTSVGKVTDTHIIHIIV